jgi:predicted nuclease with TOPRIM domain
MSFKRTHLQGKLVPIFSNDINGDDKIVLREAMNAINERMTECRNAAKFTKELLDQEVRTNRHLKKKLKDKNAIIAQLEIKLKEVSTKNTVWSDKFQALQQQVNKLARSAAVQEGQVVVDEVELSVDNNRDTDDEPSVNWQASSNVLASTEKELM